MSSDTRALFSPGGPPLNWFDRLSASRDTRSLACRGCGFPARFLFFLFLFTAPAVWAQTPNPEPSIQEKVDQVFARFDSTNSPGCAVSVIRNGNIVYEQGYGMANLDHDIPIRPHTVFHVASVSKEFTAASIALLALEGKLSLDDPIQKHLPWMADFGSRITIRNLVHHNSGIRDQWSLLGLSGWRYSRDLITNQDVVYLLKKQRELNFEPGDRYLYSNSGYTMLGLIVEAVSGQSLREFTTARIFKPLGMDRTHFRDNFSEIVKDQAYGYSSNRDRNSFELSVTNFDTVGATSLLTTVEDMAKWDRNFIDPRVGGQAFLDLIHQRGILSDGEVQTYAFGLTHGEYRGLATVGHGGADAGYRSNFVRFTDTGYSFVVLCNLAQTNPGRLAQDVAAIYLADRLAPSESETGDDPHEVELDPQEATRIEGPYWSETAGSVIIISRTGEGKLEIRTPFTGPNPRPMIYRGDGRFGIASLREAMVRFEPASGSVEKLVLQDQGNTFPPAGEEAARLESFRESSAGLGEFTGEYQSPELPIPYFITLQDGDLKIETLKIPPAELRPAARDTLVSDVGTLRFQRDASGRIAGFILEAGRVRKLRFQRQRQP